MSEAKIIARFTAPGFHRWPGAHAGREYLAQRHRHLFHVEVKTLVAHDDREIEFHDLLDAAKEQFGEGEFGDLSCEHLARRLAEALAKIFERPFTVSVFEDGEVGAEVSSAA